MEDQSSTKSFFAKMTNLVDADVPEEDKIKVMMNQSNYSTMNFNSKLGTILPENYTCFRCGNAGHHIRNCPTSGDKNFEAPQRLKKSTGIPRSFMVEVDDPNIKGVMVTNCGRYAIPAIDAEAYAIGKKERPPFLPQKQPKSESEDDPVPDELLCLICHDLLDDAVVIHCCRNSYCDDCIRTTLLDSEDHVCPTCGQSSVSPDSLTANKFLRQAVNNFKKERVCGNSLRKKPTITTSQNLTPLPGPALPPPPLKKLLQPQHMQQDSQLNHQKASKTPSCCASDVVPPVATDLASGSGSSNYSLSAQSLLTARTEAEGKMHNNSSTVSPDKEPADSLSKLVSEVSQTQVSEVNEKLSSSDPVVGLSGSSSTWDGNTLSSSCASSGSLTESNSQQLRNSHSSSSSSASSFLSPFCPNSLINAPIPTGQLNNPNPNSTYQPTLTTWTLPPRDAPSSALIPKKWYGYHRNERDRDSPSHFKLKTSHSYGLSSTHSRSSHRDVHPQSYPSTYSFGYKRPPSSTSSSSSPRCGYHSRSNSSSHHQKNRYHTRHSHKGSALRRHGKCARKEAAGPSRAYADTTKGRLELDLQLYLQWRKEFQDWYDKCYTHFHQLLLPPPPLPPHPQDSHSSGRNSGRTNDHSPLSERSSFSCSPSSQSSTDNCSTTSRSSSDSYSDKASEGHSPPSWTSSNGRRTISEDKSQLTELSESYIEKSKEIYLHETIGKQQLSPRTQNQKEENVFQSRGRDGASSPASADFLDQSREENQTETTIRNPSDSVRPLMKLEKSLEREQERKSKEEKSLERNQSRKRESKELTSREREEKKRRAKSHTQPGKTETRRAEHKKIVRKRKDSESLERIDTVGPQSSTFQKNAENPKSSRNKSPSPKKQKMEKMSLTEKDIWEEGMKVIPQKKISININLEGKRKERNDREKSSCFDMNVKEKTVETDEREKNQDGEKLEKRVDKLIDSNQEDMAKEKIKSNERKAAVTDYKKEECGKNSDKEEQNDTEKEHLELWHSTLSTAGEDDVTISKEAEGVDQGGAQKDRTEQERKTDSRSKEAAMKFSSKSLHHGQKKSPDNGSSFSVGGSCGEEGSLEKRTTEKMEEENVQDRDEAMQSKQIPCDEEWKKEEKHGRITASSSSPTVVPPDLSEPKNGTGMEEHSKQQGQHSNDRGRDKDLAPSRGTKSSLSANRGIERREKFRGEKYAEQESKQLKQGTREEGRKFTSVQKRNLPSPLFQEAERNDQQHHRGGYSSRKTSCSSREKESTSVGEVSGLPYHGVSNTQRDYDSFRRSSYHPASSVSQRDKEKPARSHLSQPSLFYNHFDSSGSLHREHADWPSKSRNEKGECRSDGSQSVRKERKSRRDEEEQKQRPSRGGSGGGNARSSDSSRGKLKNHRKEMSHNCRSSQMRKMQM